jgi:hypothetical protein
LRERRNHCKSPKMVDKTKILFTDTNGFLQVRDLKDIAWKDLFPGVQAVDVMVAPRVIEELDKHKTTTNQRRRDRARLALQVIEKASLEPDHALVLKDKPVRVRIVISNAPRFDWTAHPHLDPAKPDDQLVAEALSFGNGAEVFSHDAGPRIRARIAKIQAYEPRAEWLLPVEQTDDQRKITRLERDLEKALSRSPRIVAGFDDIDEAMSEIRLIRPVLQPLNPQLAHRLADEHLAKHPRVSLPSTSSMIMLQLDGISENQAQNYRSDYSSFEAKVRDYYANLHERVGRIGKAAAIGYFVRNESGTAAEGLRIEFDLEGVASLLADRNDAKQYIGSFKMPQPPEKPRSNLDFSHPTLPHITTLRDAMQPRDPVAFYWFHRPEIMAKHSALQCQDFRATREYRDDIFVLTAGDLPVELGLRLHVSAANLPAPLNVSAKLIISEQAVEWSDPVVQAILPDWINKQAPNLGSA